MPEEEETAPRGAERPTIDEVMVIWLVSGEPTGIWAAASSVHLIRRKVQEQMGLHPSRVKVFVDGKFWKNGRLNPRAARELQILVSQSEVEEKEEFKEKLGALDFVRDLTDHLQQVLRLRSNARRWAMRNKALPQHLLQWLQSDDTFVEEVLAQCCQSLAPTSPKLHGELQQLLLRCAEGQLGVCPGLAARLARRAELEAWKWLEKWPKLSENHQFLLNAARGGGPEAARAVAAVVSGGPLGADVQFMEALVRCWGPALEFAAEELKANVEVVTAAVESDPSALMFASRNLWDAKLALRAVKQGLSVEMVPEFLADMEVMQAAMDQDLSAFRHGQLCPQQMRRLAVAALLRRVGRSDVDAAGGLTEKAAEVYQLCRDCYPPLLATVKGALEAAGKEEGREFWKEFIQQVLERYPSFYKQLTKQEQWDPDITRQVLRWCPRMMAEVQLQAQVAAGGS